MEFLAHQRKRKLNILFVSDVSIAKVIGGAERVLFEQSTRLAQRGHRVHILTRRLPDHRQNQEVIQNVTEWRYDLDNKNTAAFVRTTYWNGKRLFEFLHGTYSFDCINFHQSFSAFGVIQSTSSKGIKKVYTCHSLSFEEFISRNAEPGGLFRKILWLLNIHTRRWIEKKVLRNSDKLLALSRFTQTTLWNAYKIPPQRVSIIPGGVDLKRFRPTDDRADIRRRLKIPKDKMVLFTVRNLVPRMGLENLILAIRKVVQTTPDIYLVLGGEGPLREHLARLVNRLGLENLVRFAGFISEDELPEYYRMADFFVLPTKELEGFGLVTLEAMASGVPVLGTPVGGTKEILSKFDPKFLFKDTTPEAMAALIAANYQEFKTCPQKFKDTSRRCRRFVERYYSWEKNVDSLEAILY